MRTRPDTLLRQDLARRGMRLTEQRRLILATVRDTESHPTAEWVHGTVIERCSAVDGTWGFKKEYYELSMKVAEPLFRDVRELGPDRVATDCPLAGLQIAQGTGLRPRHPIQILAEAYGLPAD